jgi:WD40 repeat protein
MAPMLPGRLSFALFIVTLLCSEPLRAGPPLRTDYYGDPLPPGALARMGSIRFTGVGLSGVGPDADYSPDGKLLLVGWGDGFRFLDVASGKEIRRIEGSREHFEGHRFSAGGKVVVAGGERAIRFWDAHSGRVIRTLRGHRRRVFFSVSRDGKVLASSDGEGVWLWDVETERIRHVLGGHTLPVVAIALSPDGTILASADDDVNKIAEIPRDRTVRLWEVSSGKELRRLADQKGQLLGLAFSPDGKKLLVGAEHERDAPLDLWEVATGKHLLTFDRNAWASALGFSPDGKLVTNGSGKFWDTNTGRLVHKWPHDPRWGWSSRSWVLFSPDGKTVASWLHPDHLRFREVATGKEREVAPEHRGAVLCLAITPDGRVLITGGEDGTVRTWDAHTGQPLHVLRGHQAPVLALAVSPDGKVVASADRQGEWKATEVGLGSVRLWDVASGTQVRALVVKPEFTPQLAFTPDGQTLAVNSKGGVQLWDVATGRPLRFLNEVSDRRFRGVPEPWRRAAFALAPDGRTLVMSGGEGIDPKKPQERAYHLRFWDLTTGQEAEKVPCPKAACGSVVYLPDGQRLLSAARTLWDIRRRRPIREFTGMGCLSLPVLSPDGKLLAGLCRSAGEGDVCLWEVATGQEVLHLAGHWKGTSAVAFGSDGLTLASAGDDWTALVWDLRSPSGVDVTPPPDGLSERDLARCWEALAGKDAAAAYLALCRLGAAPRQAIPFLAQHLPPAPARDVARIRRLIADLDSDDFTVRQAANRELEQLGLLAEPELRQALKEVVSAEVRRRVAALLAFPSVGDVQPDFLRPMRAIQTLERIGSVEARRVLEAVAAGEPLADLTREAREALKRLERRKPNS